MKGTLINPTEKELTDFLSKYSRFIDQDSKDRPIAFFFGLFFYAMGRSYNDKWQFWIKEDRLHCENKSKFKYVYPLKV
jgi:hypothetical protein